MASWSEKKGSSVILTSQTKLKYLHLLINGLAQASLQKCASPQEAGASDLLCFSSSKYHHI